MALVEAPLKTGEAEGEAEAVPEAATVEARAEEVQALEVEEETPVGTTTGIEVAEAEAVSGQMVVVTSVLEITVEKAGVETAEAVVSVSGQMVVLSVTSTVVAAPVAVAAAVVEASVVMTELEEPAAAERPNWVEYWYWPVPSTTRSRP
jgi:hypothetical protein